MKIRVITPTPKKLVNTINKAIEGGELKTWDIVRNDKEEVLYTHTPDQWNETAMLKPKVYVGKTVFTVTNWKKNESNITDDIRGYVLGRFIEILMVHFNKHFERLEIIK
jgi:hypothetical protein